MLSLDQIIRTPSLDDLDFWGDLDSLLWSLDSSVWLNAQILDINGIDSEGSSDSASLIAVIDLQGIDSECGNDSANLDLHYFPAPVVDDQPGHDTANLTVKGWGWTPVPRPGKEQWRQYYA